MEQSAMIEVCEEIRQIMETYRYQEARFGDIGTPGGLEHMGDVWRKLRRWDDLLNATIPDHPTPAPET